MTDPVVAQPGQPRVLALQKRDYTECWRAMQALTRSRTADSQDEIWLVEHPSVFTLGQAGKREHLLAPGDIPIVESDRGGQVTWHGPGQLVLYTLLDLRRYGLGIRQLVEMLETLVIDWLGQQGIVAKGKRDAPGVYVAEAKLAALGLRVSRGCCYHGLAINVDPDLEPFGRINPCGFENLAVTSLSKLGIKADTASTGMALATLLVSQLAAQRVKID